MGIFLLTAVTMVAFAANSVLARLALAPGIGGDGAIDASGYSLIRIASGAFVLVLLVARRDGMAVSAARQHSSWASAMALFVYVAGFSFAYLVLDTGIGALILFACVQATMIGWGLIRGDRPSVLEWVGLVVAFGAFIALVSPGLSAPDPFGTVLMVAAGIAWGIYSLRGRSVSDALASTAGNFARATPIALGLAVVFAASLQFSTWGVALAVLSGAVTSGLGYALWYRCLPQLTATRAAIVQLSVPAIATLGGVVFSAEDVSARLIICSVLILGGVAIAITAKGKRV
ncbi:MAG: DMT family transporter [Pseudomonadota bacterium]